MRNLVKILENSFKVFKCEMLSRLRKSTCLEKNFFLLFIQILTQTLLAKYLLIKKRLKKSIDNLILIIIFLILRESPCNISWYHEEFPLLNPLIFQKSLFPQQHHPSNLLILQH